MKKNIALLLVFFMFPLLIACDQQDGQIEDESLEGEEKQKEEYTFDDSVKDLKANVIESTEEVEVDDGVELRVATLIEGGGREIKKGDNIIVDYVGMFTDGKKFDASQDYGKPFAFTLGAGQVIRGWDEGVVGMKVGEKRKLTIPPELAYGDLKHGRIPPNSTLVFEVELLEIK